MEKEFTNSKGFVCIPSPAVDVPPSSRNFMLHVSFGFAQQVHLPSIHFNLGQSTSSHHENVVYSVCVGEPFQKQVKTCTVKSSTLQNF